MSYKYDFSKVQDYVADTRQKLKVQKTLEKGLHEVIWNSTGGRKTMTVTLDDKYIPGHALLTENEIVYHQTQKGAETVRAYSTDRQGWRSFNVNKVVSITKVSK